MDINSDVTKDKFKEWKKQEEINGWNIWTSHQWTRKGIGK